LKEYREADLWNHGHFDVDDFSSFATEECATESSENGDLFFTLIEDSDSETALEIINKMESAQKKIFYLLIKFYKKPIRLLRILLRTKMCLLYGLLQIQTLRLYGTPILFWPKNLSLLVRGYILDQRFFKLSIISIV
jgi:hypothetical protein